MFNAERNNKSGKEEKYNLKEELSRFFEKQQNEKRSDFMGESVTGLKFVSDEKKMRAMVEEILKNDFSDSIKGFKSYNLLVDAVINKLKRDELGDIPEDEKI